MMTDPVVPDYEMGAPFDINDKNVTDKRERHVVIEEIRMRKDQPWTKVYNATNHAMYASHPYKRDVIGTPEIISQVSQEEIMNYYKTFYSPRNVTTIIVGEFDFEEVLEKVKKEFNWGDRPTPPERNILPDKPVQETVYIENEANINSAFMMFGEKEKFVKFDNYITIFNDKDFWNACLNTVVLLISIPIGISIGLLIATYINRASKGSKLLSLLYYLPAVTSAIVIAAIWNYIFNIQNGIINTIFGLNNFDWFDSKDFFVVKIAIIIKGVWGGIGGTMLLFLAGLNNISDSYYEAADIDGASNFEKFKYITLPLVKPTTFYLLITGVIGGLQSYTDAVVFAEGHQGTRTIVWYIWNYGINISRYGYASAVSAFLAVVIMIITIIQFKKTKMLDI